MGSVNPGRAAEGLDRRADPALPEEHGFAVSIRSRAAQARGYAGLVKGYFGNEKFDYLPENLIGENPRAGHHHPLEYNLSHLLSAQPVQKALVLLLFFLGLAQKIETGFVEKIGRQKFAVKLLQNMGPGDRRRIRRPQWPPWRSR